MSNEQGYPDWYVDLWWPKGDDDMVKNDPVPVPPPSDSTYQHDGNARGKGKALKPTLGPDAPLPPLFGDVTEAEVEKAELLDRALGEEWVTKYDTSSLATKPGKSDNWIEGVGGDLPAFVRAVAHALMRQGRPRSQAIGMAIGTIKRWAAGGGDVSAKTRAKAAKTVAEWEALKAKAAAK